MKKSTLIVTQTILSLILAASVGSAAVLTMDIRSGGKILPQEIFQFNSDNNKKSTKNDTSVSENKLAESSVVSETEVKPAVQSSAEESKNTEESSKPPKEETSSKPAEESSKAESKAESKPQESSTANAQVTGLILEEPKDLKTNPKELTKFITGYGYDYDSLGFNHFIVVDSDSNGTAKVYCYQKTSKGYWWNIAGDAKPITDKGFIGSGGADFDIKAGSKKTPLGFYSLGDGFYIGEKPNSTYSLFEITDNTYWVNDPKSKFYNQKVEGTDKKDWSSAEHMITAKDAYKYGLVIEFNTSSPDKKLASAIFMHCGNAVTDGCVVVPENIMKTILEWLDKDSSAYILILP